MENQTVIICPACKSSIPDTSFFCPNCGKQLRSPTPNLSPLKQFVIYFVSLFFPPFGLWYGWQYLKSTDATAKKIGIAAIILTVISTVIALWLTSGFIDAIFKSLNEINNLDI